MGTVEGRLMGTVDDGIIERRYLVHATVTLPLVDTVTGDEALGRSFIDRWLESVRESLSVQLPLSFTCEAAQVTLDAWDLETTEVHLTPFTI